MAHSDSRRCLLCGKTRWICPMCGKLAFVFNGVDTYSCVFCRYTKNHGCTCKSFSTHSMWTRIKDPKCPEHGKPGPRFGLIP